MKAQLHLFKPSASMAPSVAPAAGTKAEAKVNLDDLLREIQIHFSQSPDPPIKLIATAIDKGKLTLETGKTGKAIVVIAPAQIYSRDLPRKELAKFLRDILGKDFQIAFEPAKTQ